MPKQVRIIGGRRFAFNGWMPSKATVERYKQNRFSSPQLRTQNIKAYKGRSSTGKMGYLVYIFTP